MSYIVQRTDRFYVVAYDGLDPLTGRERRRWHPAGSDRDEAEALAAGSDVDRAGAPPARGGPIRLGDFLRSTWLPHKRRQVRATTAYRYAWFVEHYIAPAIGHIPLRRLRADHLDDLYERLATTGGRHGDGLAPKTVLEVHMIVRAALDLAVQRRLARPQRRPLRPRAATPAGTAPARAWSADELAAFLAAARSQRLYPALHLAAHTGMRRGEIVGLKWADLDRSTRRVSIRGPCSASPGDPSSSTSRPAPADACVDLDPATITELDRWRRRLRLDGLPHGPDDWMFCNRTRTVPQPRVAQPAVRPRRAARRRAPHPLPRPAPHPRLAARRQRRTDQGRHRTPRPRPSRVHDAHLPAPPARHERRRRRAVRRPRRRRQPVDVYRLNLDVRQVSGHHVDRAGRRRR